ncbi:MAG: 50S ribosomal protein L11 methyltransferase [Polyangiaceae bacterium]|nr:50S ribosomal protein L11 methyltransferase [Polyangiaceae bacterium]NUQ75699.1 50S ribosomal protein L11 methyltransferase [Polyangiaceae bacterium]
MEQRYPFVAVDASPDEVDELSANLFELGAMGVEERDDQTLVKGAGSGRVTLVGSFENREAADLAINELLEARPSCGARLEEVVGDAWRDAWKEHFSPFLLTPRIRVVPPWAADAPLEKGEMRLELEPGRAFGTGLHATTSLVAELLDDRAQALAGEEVLDVGTGSGILALVSLLLGASRVTAIDTDEDVIEVVRENADRNALSERLRVFAGGIETVDRTFPWVLANIEARVLRPLAPALVRALEPGGVLILSGLLESEHDEMVQLYKSQGRRLAHIETRKRPGAGDDAWIALVLSDVT